MPAPQKVTLPYGGWPSVITADLITAGSVARNFPCEVDGVVYWQETRPLEQGRTTVVALQPDGSRRDLLPFPESTQSKVHEYGGLCWLVADGFLFYARKADQRIYKLPLSEKSLSPAGRASARQNTTVEQPCRAEARPTDLTLSTSGRDSVAARDPIPLTPESGGFRFADFCYDHARQRLIAVAEIPAELNDLVGAGSPAMKISTTAQIASLAGKLPQKDASIENLAHQIESHPANCIVAIPVDGSACDSERLQILAADADFFAYPRVSPDGSQLCWIAWHHPQMPWDGTELYCATIGDDGLLTQQALVAGSASESIFQPSWSPDGQLHFVSDRSGWWNLYRWDGAACQSLLPMAAEFATPLWNLGQSTYGFIDHQRIAALYAQNGAWHLGILEINPSVGRASARQPSSIEESCRAEARPTATGCNDMAALSTANGRVYFVGASASRSGDIFRLDNGELIALTDSTPALNPDNISQPQAICFPTSDGDSAYGFFYPPANASCEGPDSDKPPLIVMCHGGPTGANSGVLNYKIQYWTSRGFALLDVNYRGSTGFGRPYREKLNLNWGVVDVTDAAAGVDYLVAKNRVDPDRVIIRGSSAGGYTVLAALTFTDRFKAGASLYGIGDLETLARDTHKFEARYLDSLVGPYPEQSELYRQRSPVNHPEKLNCPVIFLQGLEDKVVPPNQAEAMVSALDQRGIPVAYVTFPDEGHGFRKAENIKTALEAELYFYRAVLGIQSPEALPAIPIRNLDRP